MPYPDSLPSLILIWCKVLLKPTHQILPFQIPGSNLKDEILLFIYGCEDLKAIEEQEDFHRGVSNTLVSINKSVISNQRKTQCCRFFGKRGVKFLVIKRRLWLCNRRFKCGSILEADKSPRLGHHCLIQRQDGTEGEIASHANRR